MSSRGTSIAIARRSRKGIVFFWVALLVWSLAMQYVAAASPSTVLAASPSANLDQCANDPAPSPATNGCATLPSDWVNGNLGASKSIYFEGDSIPYRMTFGSLDDAAGNSHDVTIEWDTTKSSKHALDYLTTWKRTVADADPCLGIAGCDSFSTDTAGIPADPQVTGAGVTPVSGVFKIFGGTITGVSAYSGGAGFSTGDNSRRITVTFSADVANPVLAWGGHIAARKDWGLTQSAVNISGSPYHMRLIDLDGSGGNQDRSLSAAAVVFPGSITVVKHATPEGNTSFPFTASPAPLTNFSLVDDGSNSDTKAFTGIIDFQTYTVTESTVAEWDLHGITCTGDGTPTINVGTQTATINLEEGQNVVCQFSNSAAPAPSLSITKDATEANYDSTTDTIHYTIVATNTGNTTLAAVTITDANATIGTCTPANGSQLAPGASMTCAASHVVTQADIDAGHYLNTACVDDGAGGAASVCDDANVPAVKRPALAIVKDASTVTYNTVGQTITYSITATNTGNTTLASVTITDPNAVLGTCTPANGSTLAPGATLTCAATHVVSQADIDAGHYLNTACVDDGAGGAASVCDDANVPAVSSKLLTILKTVTETSYDSVGDVLHYTIVATNGGNTTLTGVTVTDANAVGLTCIPVNGSTLAPAESMTCTATHTVSQADIDAGNYLNTACVSATDATATCDDIDVPSDQNPLLTIDKAVTETTFDQIGDILHYTIIATNTGNVTLHNVIVTDPNVSGLICAPDGTTLAPGAWITCNAIHTVTQADLDAGTYLNTACVNASGADEACDSADVTAAALTVVKENDAPLVEIELPDQTKATLPTAKEGSIVTFTLDYAVGAFDVTDATITDVLPAGLTYVTGSASTNAEFTAVAYDVATRTLTWTAATTVTIDGSLTYQAKVDIGAAKLTQPLTNVATIDSDQTEPDSDTSQVFVPAPPKAETAPPTDIEAPTQTGTPGSSLPLIFGILAAIFVTVALVTPVPATARRRSRQR